MALRTGPEQRSAVVSRLRALAAAGELTAGHVRLAASGWA